MSGYGLSRERFALLFAVMLVAAAGNTAMQSLLPSIGRELGVPDVDGDDEVMARLGRGELRHGIEHQPGRRRIGRILRLHGGVPVAHEERFG